MTDIQITGLTINYHSKQTPRGHCILAYFDAKVGPFLLKGCAFVRTAKQGLATWMPRLDDSRAHVQRCVVLVDEPTRAQLLTAAREMYIRMGGSGAEWRSRDDFDEDGNPLHPHRGCDVNGWPTHPLHPNYQAPTMADDIAAIAEQTPNEGEEQAREFLTALGSELKAEPAAKRERPAAIELPDHLPPAILRMVTKPLRQTGEEGSAA